MTSLLDTEAPAVPEPTARGDRTAWLEHLAAGALLLWWAVPMTRSTGGQGAGALLGALLLALALVVVTRAWVARSAWLLVTVLPVAGLVVCVASPNGWYSADAVASLCAAALAVAGTSAYARSAERRRAIVAAVCLAGVVQFADGFLAWWGGQDPTRAMTGTFYIWNPYAAFLLPGALLGIALVVSGERPWRIVGWISAPLCTAGIAFSSSRASAALLAAGALAMTALCVDRAAWRPRLCRWVAVVVLSVLTVFAFSGPPFFDHRASPGSAAAAKASTGQSVETNGAFRIGFMKAALRVVRDRPVLGTGAHGLASAARPLVPAGTARSNLVHNGFLQPFADGGLVLGLPFLLGAAGLVVAALRRLASVRTTSQERVLRIALPVALGASMAHAAVDVDWSYGSDLLLAGLLGALVLSLGTARPAARRVVLPAVIAVVALAAVVATSVWRWGTTPDDLADRNGSSRVQAAALHARGSGPMKDFRYGRAILQVAGGTDFLVQPTDVDRADLLWALRTTETEASIDATTQVLRARGLHLLGDDQGAVRLLNGLLAEYGHARSAGLAPLVAPVLAAAGSAPQGSALLVAYLRENPSGTFAGVQVHVLLQILPGSADDLKRCAFALVPSDSRLPSTPDPGAPGPGVDCTAVLQGAAS